MIEDLDARAKRRLEEIGPAGGPARSRLAWAAHPGGPEHPRARGECSAAQCPGRRCQAAPQPDRGERGWRPEGRGADTPHEARLPPSTPRVLRHRATQSERSRAPAHPWCHGKAAEPAHSAPDPAPAPCRQGHQATCEEWVCRAFEDPSTDLPEDPSEDPSRESGDSEDSADGRGKGPSCAYSRPMDGRASATWT